MNKVIVIGASSGIGKEVARIYIEKGYAVGVAARREDALQELVALAPERVKSRRLDVTAEDAGEVLIDFVEELGGADVFLNCAGIGKQNPELLGEIELATAHTNVLGFTRVVDAAYRWLRAHGGGSIAVISSIAGTKGLGAAPAYSATKRFQNTYIDALAQHAKMQKTNIRFTDIRPGFVATDLLNDSKHYPMLMKAPKVAARIVRAIERGERVCTIDIRYRILVFFWRLIPRPIWEHLPIRN